VVRPASAKVLRETYDHAFEQQAGERHSWPGDAHTSGLRAVYDKGFEDGAKSEKGKGNDRR
jgi:hypothetical protein